MVLRRRLFLTGIRRLARATRAGGGFVRHLELVTTGTRTVGSSGTGPTFGGPKSHVYGVWLSHHHRTARICDTVRSLLTSSGTTFIMSVNVSNGTVTGSRATVHGSSHASNHGRCADHVSRPRQWNCTVTTQLTAASHCCGLISPPSHYPGYIVYRYRSR